MLADSSKAGRLQLTVEASEVRTAIVVCMARHDVK